ncbi:MAG: metal-dependent transcriptional regulator [Candidatus Thermoplasmatota archaeon]|jgi:DtxR family Mn-dependent transcriptional regulator|nr:metal-dependent transcriptional regulator [Candidatus Thermoplasmatota archaeon]
MTTYREEDYLEAILHVVNRKGYAKVTDISKHLGCSAATVTEMFIRLSDRGMVNYEKYGGVTLTEKGRNIGTEIDARHQLIRDFLLVLGVTNEVAEIDACMIEHRVHQETLDHLQSFIVSFKDDPKIRKKLANEHG